jgi:hypothetical protein
MFQKIQRHPVERGRKQATLNDLYEKIVEPPKELPTYKNPNHTVSDFW